MSVARSRIVILVFAMPGCPACHEYLPRLQMQVKGFQKLGQPLVYYEPHMVTADGDVPIVIVDSTSPDPSVQRVADQYQVHALPTTILMPKVGHPAKFEGALDDQQIYELLNVALASNR